MNFYLCMLRPYYLCYARKDDHWENPYCALMTDCGVERDCKKRYPFKHDSFCFGGAEVHDCFGGAEDEGGEIGIHSDSGS